MNRTEENDPFKARRTLNYSPQQQPALPILTYHGNLPLERIAQATDSESEEDGIRIKTEETMANPAQDQGRINLPNHAQTVSLKDALRCVPEFSGEPGTFYIFQEGCEEAKEMIGVDAEANLVKIIRSKVTGEARRTLKGQTFNTVNGLVNHLKEIYFATKPLFQLYGDLGKLHQKPDERVITFANRVREILYRIIEAYIKERNPQPQDLQAFKTQLETNSISTFKRGLKPEIEQRMTVDDTLANAITDAIRAEKYLRDKDELHLETMFRKQDQLEYRRRTYTCQICNRENHEAISCPVLMGEDIIISTNRRKLENTEKQVLAVKTDIECQICEKNGHSAKDCYQMKKPERKTDIVCQICDKRGHDAKNCFRLKPSPKSTNTKETQCGKCKNKGHTTDACYLDLNKRCIICDRVGHLAETCRMKKQGNKNQKN